MHILVIGGTGITGPYTVRRLHEMGHKVIIAHRGEHEVDLPPEVEHLHHPSLNAEYREGLKQLADEFKRFSPDIVLDMILCTERGAQAVTQTFKGIAGRVIAISSVDVYRAYGRLHGTEPGPIEPMPLTEDSPLRETNQPAGEMYDKIAVERIILSEPELPGTILRWPAVHGPRTYRLFSYLKRMDDKRPAILMRADTAQWRWSRSYAENVAEATLLAVTNTRSVGRIYNVAEPEAFEEAEWAKQVASAAGWKGEIVIVPKDRTPAWMEWRGTHEQHYVVDSTRLREGLGYKEIVPQAEAMRRTVEWERANPPAEINPEHFDYAKEDALLAEIGWSKAG